MNRVSHPNLATVPNSLLITFGSSISLSSSFLSLIKTEGKIMSNGVTTKTTEILIQNQYCSTGLVVIVKFMALGVK
ncbi:MAG: hypothetical protein ACTSR1_09180 [Candidatus Heimdallarchaeota archaeon]